jgi:hypothetical protein
MAGGGFGAGKRCGAMAYSVRHAAGIEVARMHNWSRLKNAQLGTELVGAWELHFDPFFASRPPGA